MAIAIIKTGGKQYKVAPGQKIKIEKIAGNEGDAVTFDEVFLVAADERGSKDTSRGNEDIKIGQPLVAGAKVIGKILKQDREDKITVLKYKSKKRYSVKRGHRQPFTTVEIESVK